MNYKRIYKEIITNAYYLRICRDNDWYLSNGNTYNDWGFEMHHIVPKCIGGTNSPDNLIPLTPREHFICHWLLCKIHPENEKLSYAWHAMCRYTDTQEGRRENSHSFAYAKRKLAEILHIKFKGKKNPAHSLRMQGVKNPMYGKHHSAKSNESNRQKHLGIKMSETARQKMSISAKKAENKGRFQKGHKMSTATKQKLYMGCICEYCKKEMGIAAYKRYHGENCLQNPNRPLEEIIASRKWKKK